MVTDLTAIPRELRGLHPDNPVNRVRGGGAQLELSPRLRGISPRSGPPGEDGLSPPTSALIQGLAAARTLAGPLTPAAALPARGHPPFIAPLRIPHVEPQHTGGQLA